MAFTTILVAIVTTPIIVLVDNLANSQPEFQLITAPALLGLIIIISTGIIVSKLDRILKKLDSMSDESSETRDGTPNT